LLAKTYEHLADLNQRYSLFHDLEALGHLADVLSHVEALANEKHLSIQFKRADLCIWLERNLAANGFHSGADSKSQQWFGAAWRRSLATNRATRL
jgi:hypothetical protein